MDIMNMYAYACKGSENFGQIVLNSVTHVWVQPVCIEC